MKKWSELTFDERQKIEDLFNGRSLDLALNIFSQKPYVRFSDGTIVYLEGAENLK